MLQKKISKTVSAIVLLIWCIQNRVSNSFILQAHSVQLHLSFSVPSGTVATSCLTGNTITFPGPLAWLLLVLSSTMFPAFFFWSRPASFEGKRLLGRNNILWSREFKKDYLDINKKIINAHAWHCPTTKASVSQYIYRWHTYFSIIKAIDLTFWKEYLFIALKNQTSLLITLKKADGLAFRSAKVC